MKKITCRQMGGPCDTAFYGESPEKIMNQGVEHLKNLKDTEHHKILVEMNKMSDEENQIWNQEFQKIWLQTPEE